MAFDASAFFAKVMVVTCLHILMCQNKQTVMKIAVGIDTWCEMYLYMYIYTKSWPELVCMPQRSLSLFCLVCELCAALLVEGSNQQFDIKSVIRNINDTKASRCK